MFLSIGECITEVFHELQQLREDTKHTKGWAESFVNQQSSRLAETIDRADREPEVHYSQEAGDEEA